MCRYILERNGFFFFLRHVITWKPWKYSQLEFDFLHFIKQLDNRRVFVEWQSGRSDEHASKRSKWLSWSFRFLSSAGRHTTLWASGNNWRGLFLSSVHSVAPFLFLLHLPWKRIGIVSKCLILFNPEFLSGHYLFTTYLTYNRLI